MVGGEVVTANKSATTTKNKHENINKQNCIMIFNKIKFNNLGLSRKKNQAAV